MIGHTGLLRNRAHHSKASCALAIVAIVSTSSRADEPSPRQRFEKEAPGAWAKLIERASCVAGEGSAKKIDGNMKVVLSEEGPAGFRINGLLGYSPIGGNGKTRVLCQNLDYEFVVEQLNADKWGIRQMIWKNRNDQQFAKQPYCDVNDGTIGHLPWQLALAYACRGVIINITWLPHVAASPTFKVVEATKVSQAAVGADLVRIKFENKAPRLSGINMEGGEITFDAKRLWQIVDARITAHYGDKGPEQLDMLFEINNEFAKTGNLPYVKRQVLRTQSLPVVNIENVYETKLELKDRNDVRPFTLPAFGLPVPAPEPPTETQQGDTAHFSNRKRAASPSKKGSELFIKSF